MFATSSFRTRTTAFNRAYLLFEGRILKQGSAEDLAADETVRKVYLGKNFELRRRSN